VDYDLGGALLAWLATGEPAHADRAIERWRQLLVGNRELRLTVVGEIETITALTAASLRDNFARAQPDEIVAIHAEAERMLHVGVAGATRDVRAGTILRRRGLSPGEAGAGPRAAAAGRTNARR